MKYFAKACWAVLFLASIVSWAGCASTGNETMGERPWNAPQNWENGLPPSMMEGR